MVICSKFLSYKFLYSCLPVSLPIFTIYKFYVSYTIISLLEMRYFTIQDNGNRKGGMHIYQRSVTGNVRWAHYDSIEKQNHFFNNSRLSTGGWGGTNFHQKGF